MKLWRVSFRFLVRILKYSSRFLNNSLRFWMVSFRSLRISSWILRDFLWILEDFLWILKDLTFGFLRFPLYSRKKLQILKDSLSDSEGFLVDSEGFLWFLMRFSRISVRWQVNLEKLKGIFQNPPGNHWESKGNP